MFDGQLNFNWHVVGFSGFLGGVLVGAGSSFKQCLLSSEPERFALFQAMPFKIRLLGYGTRNEYPWSNFLVKKEPPSGVQWGVSPASRICPAVV